jgi:signal peptidase I
MSFFKKINQSGWPAVIVLFVLVFAARSVIADWNPVPTGSMKPTILEGDVILVNRAAYDLKVPFTTRHLMNWEEPQVGEIVVLNSPDDGARLVKRIIAGPGDHLELRGDTVLLNGVPAAQQLAPIADWAALSESDRMTHRGAFETLAGHDHPMIFPPATTLSWVTTATTAAIHATSAWWSAARSSAVRTGYCFP